jgi:hypothetical protein
VVTQTWLRGSGRVRRLFKACMVAVLGVMIGLVSPLPLCI